LAAASDALRAPAPEPEQRLHLRLGSYKAVRVLSALESPDALAAARAACDLATQGLVTDAADPRLLELPAEVETSPAWRPFGNRDLIALYRAAWIACGLRALAARVGGDEARGMIGRAEALERKMLAAQDARSGGFPGAFADYPTCAIGVNPTFMVLWGLLDVHPWARFASDRRGAVRAGAAFLRRTLERERGRAGVYYPGSDEAGRPITEEHPRFDAGLFFLQRVRTGEPVEHIWLVAGPAMAAARWARALAEAGEADGADFGAAVDLALASVEAVRGCARPLENLSVGKLICAGLDLLAVAEADDRIARERESLRSMVREAADFLSREGEVRDGGRTRWYWEKYHPKRDGRPADAPCPARMTAGVLDYTVEIGYWLWSAAAALEGSG
jgi:hypothetical protein